jgi:hypothetical protein
MNRRSLPWLFGALCLAGCIKPPPPAFVPVQTIAVFPANNLTGDTLLIAGGSLLEKYVMHTDRYTVGEALADEARAELMRRGFEVVEPELVNAAMMAHSPSSAEDAASLAAHAHIQGAVLYIEIRRWEPDVAYKPTGIIVSLSVSLLDTATGRVLWTANHPLRPVQTPGVINLGNAYSVAARTLMRDMLAPLLPKRTDS